MTLKRSFLAVVLTLVSLGHSWGQATDANGNVTAQIIFAGPSAITTTFVEPPAMTGGGSGGSSDNTQWLKVEWHYAVKPTAPLPFVDSVQFRVWIEGRDLYDPTATTAEGLAVALTGTVTYVNLAATNDAYGVVYVHPSTLARYSSKNGYTDFERKFNVHVEAYVGGAKQDAIDKNKETDLTWYSTLHSVPNMVYRQDQCVFIVTDASRYPQLKLPASGQ
jgi:hypothetical protein